MVKRWLSNRPWPPRSACHICGASVARKRGEILVLTGVNLPVLIDYLHNRDQVPVAELAERLLKKGQESLRLQRGQPQ